MDGLSRHLNIIITVIIVVVIIMPAIVYNNQHQLQCIRSAARKLTQWRVRGQ